MFRTTVLLLVFVLAAGRLHAYEVVSVDNTSKYDARKWKSEPLWIDRAFGKFVNGFWNLVFGASEIATEPYEAAMVGKSVIIGLGKGVVFGALDVVGGGVNVVTFPLTFFEFPLPEGGVETREF